MKFQYKFLSLGISFMNKAISALCEKGFVLCKNTFCVDFLYYSGPWIELKHCFVHETFPVV